jgi:hypothetical protein
MTERLAGVPGTDDMLVDLVRRMDGCAASDQSGSMSRAPRAAGTASAAGRSVSIRWISRPRAYQRGRASFHEMLQSDV